MASMRRSAVREGEDPAGRCPARSFEPPVAHNRCADPDRDECAVDDAPVVVADDARLDALDAVDEDDRVGAGHRLGLDRPPVLRLDERVDGARGDAVVVQLAARTRRKAPRGRFGA